MTNHLRNDNNLNLKIFQSTFNWRGTDIKFNSSMNMKILILFVVKMLAFKISSINKWRQFSLCLDLVISKIENKHKLLFKKWTAHQQSYLGDLNFHSYKQSEKKIPHEIKILAITVYKITYVLYIHDIRNIVISCILVISVVLLYRHLKSIVKTLFYLSISVNELKTDIFTSNYQKRLKFGALETFG